MSDIKLIKKLTFRSVAQVFSGNENAPLRIPEYQRPYAWTADELNDFIRDLTELKDLRLSKTGRTHFFGGVVVYEESNDDIAPEITHHVVDGQQRLLTLQLTMALIKHEYIALLNAFETSKNKDYIKRCKNKIDEIENFFVFKFTSTLGDSESVSKLEASERDQFVYMKVLNDEDKPGDATSASHKRIRSAKNRLRKNLILELQYNQLDKDSKVKVEKEEYFQRLGILLDCIKDDCHIIYIVCPSLEDAYELFQVLNDRGKSLTDGDLLRAYTFQKINELDKDRKFYDSLRPYWDEILSFSDGNIKSFLEQYLRMYTGERAQSKQLYRQFREAIFENEITQFDDSSPQERLKALRDRVMDLRDSFRIYITILRGEWPFEPTHSAIDDYDKSRLRFLITILGLKNLSIFLAAQEKLSQTEFRDLVYLVERFFFRYRTICGGSAVSIGDCFGKHAKNILDENFSIDDFKEDLQEMIDEDASDGIFMENIRSELSYKENNKHIIKYFLLFIEDYRPLVENRETKHLKAVQDQKISVPVIKKSSTIEHIYPQNPPQKEVQTAILNHPARGNLTDTIGNLTILGRLENNSLGNANYETKRAAFEGNNLWINRLCAEDHNKWDENSLLKRETWLIDSALKIFKL